MGIKTNAGLKLYMESAIAAPTTITAVTKAAAGVFASLCPGGAVVYVGIPLQPIAYDVAAAMVKEARVEHVFRYAHVYPRAIALMASGKLNVKPLITDTFRFAESVEAFDFAVNMPPTSVKAQIVVAE